MEVGKKAIIVDSDKLPQSYTSVLQHYANGTIATIKSIVQGIVEIEVKSNVATMALYADEISAIEVID